ncbi:signal peptidase I [Lacisediminihabitans changchengi]|uniref:Signal peptidase I n=1 Tax=Lacisediminihabitans changchengi TaxID=2787634 RepID=A0A934W271_9MICO|nr:signal peptidase I [Lacisediminihabitans changchengi]MBK4346531.1 signal peptidase I [Lacisediminihabitans changchengi]
MKYTAVATAPTEQKAGQKKRKKHGTLRFARDVVVVLVVAVILSIGVKTFLVRAFYIPSASMTNTLQMHDRILVNELIPKLSPLHHGDVVVFTDPGGWLPGEVKAPATEQNPMEWVLSAIGLTAPATSDNLVKRVIGLPGDTVSCCTAFGQVSVNGTPINEQQYIHLNNGAQDAYPRPFEVTVPEGSLWVLGDNRDNSGDSGYHYRANVPGSGFVPLRNVVGRAFVITWPSAHWAWLDDYPDVFAGADR